LPRFGTVVIVGVGLIGGSIGLALRSRGLSSKVVGFGRDPAKLDEARRLGAIDVAATDLATAVDGADVAVVCTPVSKIAQDCHRIAALGPDRLLITDAGSTKAEIVRSVERDPRARSMFCAAHPIAGSEKQGASASRADLFDGRIVALTPTDLTPEDRVRRASEFWRSLGAKILTIEPGDHDLALAYTSHLPHAIASVLAGVIPERWLPLAAGAYRDATRVASADKGLWADIFLANPQHLRSALGDFRRRLDRLDALLAAGDADGLSALWAEAKDIRERFAWPPGDSNP
jgi:prephenate dehydrogenase